MIFGNIAIWVALLATTASAGAYLAAGRPMQEPARARLTRWGRRLFILGALGILGAAATLGALLVTHRFDVAYVYQHSARAMAPLYWFPSFWAGQEGSFLLWAFWTALLGVILVRTAGNAERRVMPIYSVVLLFLVSMLALRSPFVPLDTQGMPAPTEGLGLNPNLENPWMVIHPPTLFLGFASLAVPFAFAVSALLWRDWDGWLRRALPWGLFGFAVLGLAMMMGGYWAYEMLGWGGFWGWDPVENGPFIPWMALIAFLHASQIARVRGGLGRTTLFFGTLPFVGVLYESFMTRSGVLTDFSVHSFSALGGAANTILLGALLVVVAVSVGLLAWRAREIARRDAGYPGVWEAPQSREYAYTLAVTLLTLCGALAAIGMSAPLLTALAVKLHLAQHTASVNEDYHNRVMFPLAVLVAVGLGIGPHLAWRGRGAVDSRKLLTAYVIAVLGAWGFFMAAHVLGSPLSAMKMVPQLVLFTAALFALVSNIQLLSRAVPRQDSERRTGLWSIGGVLSHIGAVVFLLGVACLVTFVRKQTDVLLVKDTPVSVLGGQYRMTYIGQTGDYQTDRNNALLFAVASQNGREHFTARMPLALRAMEGGDKKMIGHPAIVHHAGGDLYFALKDGPDQFYPRGRFVEKIPLGGNGTFGPYHIQFVRFERDPRAAALAMSGQMPDVFPVSAVLRVTYHGQTTLLRPQHIQYSPAYLQANPAAPPGAELALPGGWLVAFQNMNAGSADKNNPNAGAMSEAGSFVLRPPGPVLEGFEVDVTTRPMINLVWIGTLLLFAGGLVSMRRRILENREAPIPDLPLPEASAPTRQSGAARRRAKGRVVGASRPAPTLMAGRKGR